ncbi:MAG: tetratricopeptide repeat protein [Gallionella sp.]
MKPSKATRRIWLGLAAASALAVIAYWPSLHGGYVFDDIVNIVLNTNVHIQALDWHSLGIATVGPPSAAHRPLAMLSFAIDWYLGGGDPLRMKIENLIIHLINGFLLFGLLRTLLRARLRAPAIPRADWLALCVTAAWLLAPINFTAVAYIVQRMESLSQLFVLAGLWGYIAARERMREGQPGLLRAVASILLGTAIGGLSKESAVLLPLYAVIAEWIIFGFERADGRIDRRLLAMYLLLLVLPAFAALCWVAGHALPAAAWAGRPFTIGERLLTEPRVLWDYVQWAVLPLPNQMSLYHDDIAISHGWFDPPTTALAILALAFALFAGARLRRTRPLVALGIGWFFAAHLLTATVIPLEIAFEHRNYFASIGLYLALFSVVVPCSAGPQTRVRIGACVALIVFFATVTWIRALNWGNPLLFALSEAQMNPHSPRAAYELAGNYMELVQTQDRADPRLVAEAFKTLQHAATMPGANILPDQGLLLLSVYLHRESPADAWARMQHKLATQPLTVQNVDALNKLTSCTLHGACELPANEMVKSFLAALQHTPTDTRVLSIYASYAFNVLHDPTLALNLARDAIKEKPTDMQVRANMLVLLVANGQREQAEAFYAQTLQDLPQARYNAKFRALLHTPSPAK